jgi:hypothetical protein
LTSIGFLLYVDVSFDLEVEYMVVKIEYMGILKKKYSLQAEKVLIWVKAISKDVVPKV